MPIADLILELERLREKNIKGSTPSSIFQQIKGIFHIMESIGSSRIEGNNTTVVDYVETAKISPDDQSRQSHFNEDIKEILNIEKAMMFIEDYVAESAIDKRFIRELHSIVVDGLSPNKEGAIIVGGFRETTVAISGSKHQPPEPFLVEELMDELISFINQASAPKFDLLRIALAHHRLVWIHPFENGNGRVVRLFTYALLIKFIFKNKERIINPTAVFCSDRNNYYHYLDKADAGTDEGYIEWSMYMLQGLKVEIEKIENLSDYDFLKNQILYPALSLAENHQHITHHEHAILKLAIREQEIKSGDIKGIINVRNSSQASRYVRSLVDKKMLNAKSEGGRIYEICFLNNILMRSILELLSEKGFLPIH